MVATRAEYRREYRALTRSLKRLRVLASTAELLRANDPIRFWADALARGVCLTHADRKSERFLAEPVTENLPIAPHAAQACAHRSDAQTVCLIGGNRTGKTQFLVISFGMVARGMHRYWQLKLPCRLAIVSPTEKQQIRVMRRKIQQWLGPGWRWDTTNHGYIYDQNGSQIILISSKQDPSSVAGDDLDAVGFDEPPDKLIHDECRARLLDRSGRRFFTMTPLETDYPLDWFRDEVFTPWESGQFDDGSKVLTSEIGRTYAQLRAAADDSGKSGGVDPLWIERELLKALARIESEPWTLRRGRFAHTPDIDIFFLDADDNPSQTAEQIDREYRNASEEIIKQRRLGRFVFSKGLAFKNLMQSVHGAPEGWLPPAVADPAAYRQHIDAVEDADGMVIKPASFRLKEDGWALYRTIDPGIRYPCAIQWWAVDRDGNCVMYREFYQEERTVKEIVEWIRQHQSADEEQRIIDTFIDPNARQRKQDGTRTTDLWEDEGIMVTPSINDREGGLILMHEAMHVRPDLPNLFNPDAPGGPRLYVSKSCTEWWRLVPQMRYESGGGTAREPKDATREVLHKFKDHHADATRYFLAKDPQYEAPRQPIEDDGDDELEVGNWDTGW